MKRLSLVIVAMSILANSALAAGIGAFGSYWDSEDAGESYGYGVRLASTSDPAGFLEVRASRFNQFEDKDTGKESELDIIPIDIGITLNMSPEDSLQFYIGGGGSYYMMETEVDTPTGSKDVDLDDEWGWYGLIGLNIKLSDNLMLFGEGCYRQVEGTIPEDDLEEANSDVTFKLDGFGGSAGLMLMF